MIRYNPDLPRHSGVGFGICQRLLLQLASTNPSDAQPQEKLVSAWGSQLEKTLPLSNVQGLTLIMACRSVKRAEEARTKLYNALDAFIEKQRKLPGYDGHAASFRENLTLVIHSLDLASIPSVLRFSAEISQKYAFISCLLNITTNDMCSRYPYVSHLICNAGVASFTSIEWVTAIKQLCTEPVIGVTAPLYYRQRQGEISADGLGWVWQCNVFGHYCLVCLNLNLTGLRSLDFVPSVP